MPLFVQAMIGCFWNLPISFEGMPQFGSARSRRRLRSVRKGVDIERDPRRGLSIADGIRWHERHVVFRDTKADGTVAVPRVRRPAPDRWLRAGQPMLMVPG